LSQKRRELQELASQGGKKAGNWVGTGGRRDTPEVSEKGARAEEEEQPYVIEETTPKKRGQDNHEDP